MTNEQKAQRLDQMSTALHRQADYSSLCAGLNTEGSSRRAMHEANQRQQESDAALLREAAAMMRERGAVQWVKVAGSATRQMALYRGWLLKVREDQGWWKFSAECAKNFYEHQHHALWLAQAAAVAWVDEQEGRDV